MKTYVLLTLFLGVSGFINGQITSNAPATVSAFGGKYYIQFTITNGTWYNTRSASVDYGGITFPFAGSSIQPGTGPQYYFTVDPNNYCQRDLQIILQDVGGVYGTTTFTITQLSTVPSLSILPTITGPSTVCIGASNRFKITTTPGSYTTWISTNSLSTVIGNTKVPITGQWNYGDLTSSSISGGVLNAIFTSPGLVIVQRNNFCSSLYYDTLRVNVYLDTVNISPTVDNVSFGTPITFTASGTSKNPNAYSFWIINGNTNTPQLSGHTFTYSNYTYGDTVYAQLWNITCNTTIYSKKVAIIGGTPPVTDIQNDNSNKEFRIYPNPFVGSFNVENGDVITITDLLGNPIPFTRTGDKYYVEKRGLLFVNTDKGTIKINQ